MDELTEKQQEVLNFIHSWLIANHNMPVMEEIAQAFNVYPNCAHGHVKALIRKGVLIKLPYGRYRLKQNILLCP